MTSIERVRLGVFNETGSRQAVLRQANPAGKKILADLLVLQAIKAEVVEERSERLLPVPIGIVTRWEHVIKQGLNHARVFRLGAACCGEALQLGTAHRRQLRNLRANERRHLQGVIACRHQGIVTRKQCRLCSMLVDCEIVDHRLNGKGNAAIHLAPGLTHDGLQAFLSLRLPLGGEEESHTTAAHAAEHPEAPEVVSEFFANAVDQRVRVKIGGPRNNGLDGAIEVALQAAAERADVAALKLAGDLIEDADRLLAAEPSDCAGGISR